MFFLFGWGRQTTKEQGPTLASTCANCHNKTWFHLKKTTNWFTLFFIPLVPYKSANLLVCPICSRTLELKEDQHQRAIQLNKLTKAFTAKQISEADYVAAAKKINIF